MSVVNIPSGACCTGMRTRSAASADDSEVRRLLTLTSQVRHVQYALRLSALVKSFFLFLTTHV